MAVPIEPQAEWTRYLDDCSVLTLHRMANTCYTGKRMARGMMPYTGGVGPHRGICNEVVSRGMLGFKLTGPNCPTSATTARSCTCNRCAVIAIKDKEGHG